MDDRRPLKYRFAWAVWWLADRYRTRWLLRLYKRVWRWGA